MGNTVGCVPQRVTPRVSTKMKPEDSRQKPRNKQLDAYKDLLFYQESCDYLHFVRSSDPNRPCEQSPVLSSLSYITECLEQSQYPWAQPLLVRFGNELQEIKLTDAGALKWEMEVNLI
jgi:hypothetical protein